MTKENTSASDGSAKASKVKDENYVHVPGWAVTRLGLKGNELLVYSIIYGFSQDGETRFTGSLQYLADWTNSTKQCCIKCLKELVKKGFIKKYEKVVNGVKFCEYQGVKPKLTVLNKVERGIKQSLMGGIKQSLTNNIDIDNIEDNIEDKGAGVKEKESQEMERVYQHYLNKFGTTSGRYKLTDKRKAKLRSRLQDCGAEMLIDAIDHAHADYFYNGDNDRGWKADLDFIVRSYENVEKLANLSPRKRKLTWQEKKEQEEQAEFDRKFGEPKYVYEPFNLEEGSYELLEGTSDPDEPTREPFSEDFIEEMRQRAFGGKKKEAKNDN